MIIDMSLTGIHEVYRRPLESDRQYIASLWKSHVQYKQNAVRTS